MKQLTIQLWLIILGVVLLQACAKEPSFDYPEGYVGHSKVVNFPSVAIKGERLIIQDQVRCLYRGWRRSDFTGPAGNRILLLVR